MLFPAAFAAALRAVFPDLWRLGEVEGVLGIAGLPVVVAHSSTGSGSGFDPFGIIQLAGGVTSPPDGCQPK